MTEEELELVRWRSGRCCKPASQRRQPPGRKSHETVNA